jgi:hypothetical protein
MKQPKDFPMGKLEQHMLAFKVVFSVSMSVLAVMAIYKYLGFL